MGGGIIQLTPDDTRHLVAPGADEKREGRAHRVIYGSAVGGNDPWSVWFFNVP
jgi:hypothetical protein